MDKTKPVRLGEVDALRGVAILMMVLFHAAIDIDLTGIAEIPWDSFEGWFFGYLTRFLFWMVFGVSVALSSRSLWGQTKRAVFLILCGGLVSLGSSLWAGEDFVRFGILSMLGFSLPIVRFFKGRPQMALVAAALAVWFGPYFDLIFREFLFSPWDYVPLLPNLAVPLLGLAVGEWVYVRRDKQPTFLSVLADVPGLVWLGRHSLMIYLLHIPVLYFTLLGLSALFF